MDAILQICEIPFTHPHTDTVVIGVQVVFADTFSTRTAIGTEDTMVGTAYLTGNGVCILKNIYC